MSTSLTRRRRLAVALIVVAVVAVAVARAAGDPAGLSPPDGALVVLPVLAGAGLAAIALLVRRRGRLGSRSGPLARTLVAGIAGIAGWIAAALVVRTTAADVPIDDRSFVLVTVALPVTLATHLGWADRRRAWQTGLAAAFAGAVLGTWLGFDTLLTAAVGGVAGANLALIARDVWTGDDPYPVAAGP